MKRIPRGRAYGWWKKFWGSNLIEAPEEVPVIPTDNPVTPSEPVSIGGKMKTGTVVWVNLDGKQDLLGLYVKDAGDKDVIQVGSELEHLGYREPADRDAEGAGRTWWKVS